MQTGFDSFSPSVIKLCEIEKKVREPLVCIASAFFTVVGKVWGISPT